MNLYQQKRYNEALYLAKNFLKIHSNSYQLLNFLGIISLKLQDLISAKSYFKSCITANPNFVHSYHHLGLIYADMKEFEKAVKYYRDAIKLDPNYA